MKRNGKQLLILGDHAFHIHRTVTVGGVEKIRWASSALFVVSRRGGTQIQYKGYKYSIRKNQIKKKKSSHKKCGVHNIEAGAALDPVQQVHVPRVRSQRSAHKMALLHTQQSGLPRGTYYGVRSDYTRYTRAYSSAD
ncbi:unnamed protein product [Colias eurytheme]|nr:unnamed protein product [Colias eurytheme]